MSLLLMWKQQLLMNNFKYFSVTGSGSLLLPGSVKARFKELALNGDSTQGENPTPEAPQEIKSAGRKSKNLLNLQKEPDVKGVYWGWKVGNGKSIALSIKDKGNNADITRCYLGLSKTGATSDGVVWAVDSGTIKAKEITSENQYISVYPPNETAVRKLLERFEIQAEEGNATTDYEPYGYLLDLKVIGKNLFDSEKARDINNWTDSIVQPGYIDFSIYVGKGNSVNISYSENLEAGLGFYAGIAQSVNNGPLYWLYHSSQQSLNKNNYKLIAECDYISVRVIKSNLQGFLEHIKTLQIENSNTPTSYEPYQEQTLTLTSDRPLTKWDKLTEQGGEYGWLYQSAIDSDVKPSRADLFPYAFGLYKKHDNGAYTYRVFNSKKINGYQTSYCKQFTNKNGSYNTGELFCYSDQPSLKDQYFTTDIQNLEEFITWMEANPLTMIYKTVETEFVPLSESEQIKLRNLHSYNGTTHIFVDSGEVAAEISATYMRK